MMKKTVLAVISAILVLFQLIGVTAITASASKPFGGSTTPSSMTVYKTDPSKMKVNGQSTVGEAWDLVEWSTTSYGYGGQHWVDANKCDFKFKALWAEEGTTDVLYMLFDVQDETLPSDTFGWATDHVKVFLDETCSVTAGNKVTNTYGYYCRNHIANGDYQKSIYKVVEKSDQKGYILEVKIPLSSTVEVRNGTVMKAQIQLQNGDLQENLAQKMWSASDDAWDGGKTAMDYADHFGTLTFSDETKVSFATDDSVEDADGKFDEFIPPEYVVKQTNAENMKIDGAVSTYESWDDAEWVVLTNKFSSEAISKSGTYLEFSTKFKALWATTGTKSYLYFLIDVDDKNLTSVKRAWASDNIRVFVDETGKVDGSVKALLNRGADYASSEFMSYATDENSSGFKYSVTKKAGDLGYVLELQYTFLNEELAVKDAKMKVNVTINDADSTQDDGTHFAQQFAWSQDKSVWAQYKDIAYCAHAGIFKLSDEMLAKEIATEPKETDTQPTERVTEVPTEADVTASETDNGDVTEGEKTGSGCGAAVCGASAVFALACAMICLKKKKEND